MTQHYISDVGDAPPVDWAGHLNTFWQARYRLLATAAVVGLIAAVATFARSKYESEGVYQLYAPSLKTIESSSALAIGQPSFGDFKLISALLSDPARMREYLAARGLDDDSDVANLPGLLLDTQLLRQSLAPVYAYTKADAKEFIENPTLKEAAGQVVGLRVAASARSSDVAQKRSKVLADYVRDTAFFQALTEYIRLRDNELKRSALAYENSVIGNRYNAKVATDRLRELRAVSVRNPDAARVEGRSVLSLTDSTTRFLPLSTQMMAVEVGLADINLSFEAAKRSRDQAEYTMAYFDALHKAAAVAKTAETIMKAMPAAKAVVDKGRDLNDEKFKQISNATQLEILTLEDAYYNRTRFVVGPNLPERSLRMPLLALILGGLFGLAGMIVWTLIRNWVVVNKPRILGSLSRP